jgi:hypothetical protein
MDKPPAATPDADAEEGDLFIGQWERIELDEKARAEGFDIPSPSGTLLIVTAPHAAFVTSFRDTLRPPISASQERKEASHKTVVDLTRDSPQPPTYDEIRRALPPSDWKEFLEITRNTDFLESRGDYWRFLWELAASCPLPYTSSEVVPGRLVVGDQQRLSRYRFRIEVDGRELKKPVSFDDDEYSTSLIAPYKDNVFGRELSFHGYIVAREGKQLKPDEFQGLLVRIKDVGVGTYDSSLLGYRVNQGPRSRWLTGEIFVDEGLEDAVNVDRDSFNAFHPHYKELQRIVHIYLARAFSLTYVGITKRSKASAKRRSVARRSHLANLVEETLLLPVELQTASGVEAEIHLRSRKAVVELPDPEALRTKGSYRELASAILGIYTISQQPQTAGERAQRFKEMLLELLKKW